MREHEERFNELRHELNERLQRNWPDRQGIVLPDFSNPDTRLEEVFKHVVLITLGKEHTPVRKVAVSWFNRLYYDIRKWNEQLLQRLHEYPGFKDSKQLKEYQQFFEKFRTFYPGDDRDTRADICTRIHVLVDRFVSDFAWLKVEDENAFYYIYSLAIAAREHRGHVFDMGSALVSDRLMFNKWYYLGQDNDQAKHHAQYHSEVVRAILDYEEESKEVIHRIHLLATRAGVTLLTVDEYEEALRQENAEPYSVLLVGEMTMGSKYNISGSQVGAVGDHAKAEDFTQQQIVQQDSEPIDLQALARELAQLRIAASEKASEPEDHAAVGSIAAAEAAANKGDEAGALKYLKSAGGFALKVAQDVSANIAVEVLKKQIGI